MVAHFEIPTKGSYTGKRFACAGAIPEERKSLRTYEPLMTVAQHKRIVAALSAQQSAPERLGVPVEFRKVSDKILAKLIRFAECAEDFEAGGVDIGRDWLDTLTHLGLLERVQRSPALWQATDEADAIIDAQRALLNGGEA